VLKDNNFIDEINQSFPHAGMGCLRQKLFRCWILDFGFWILDFGCWMLDFEVEKKGGEGLSVLLNFRLFLSLQ
jgi:hypothetical protein